jgi:hypothetical protein
MNTQVTTALEKARRHWGAEMPEWIAELAGACDAASQNKVARKLGCSASVVSQVLSRSYRGSLETVEQRVRGALMAETLICPVMGEIRRSLCVDNQRFARGKFQASSSMRARLYRACRGSCGHSRIGGTS